MKVKIQRGLKYRIYPTDEQTVLINKTLGCARFVFNHFLGIRQDEWKYNHKSVQYKDTNAMLTDLKRRPEYSWLNEVDSMALQQSLRDLQRAYDNFFAKRAKYPRFKSKHHHTQSYRSQCVTNNIRVEGNGIKLPKLGIVKIKLSRPVVGVISNATITRTAGNKYYVSLCVSYEAELFPNEGSIVGIDVGVKDFYADSNGAIEPNPRYFNKYQRKLAREQRRLARKMNGSSRRERQRVRVARLHEKITNVRADHHHKISTRLAKENQIVVVEDLKIKNMVKNKHLSKAISDVAWYKFFTMLEYKLAERGGQLIKVPTFYPSSQTCNVCGYKNPIVKNLAVRDWECPECGTYHENRDLNAAINIKEKGLAILKEVA